MVLREGRITTIIITEISLRKATGVAKKLSKLSGRRNEEDHWTRRKMALLLSKAVLDMQARRKIWGIKLIQIYTILLVLI
jgi:hypothetical protein